MENVKLNKKDLLKVIKKNRKKHVEEYESASKIFIEDAIAKLQEMLKVAQTKGRIIQSLGLAEPKSYVESYDTAIRMLEMSVDEVIELSEQEFKQFVEDNWVWKSAFTTTTSFYNSKLAQ